MNRQIFNSLLTLAFVFSVLGAYAQDTSPDKWEDNGNNITTPPAFNGIIDIKTTNPNKLGLKVGGGRAWIHNNDNGANSSVLELGIHKNWNTPNFQIFSADGGGHNYMTTHGWRWGSHFRWTRSSQDGRQFMASIGGDDNFGQYLRLYGVAPDSANVTKVLLRTKNHSYINSTGRFGLGTASPQFKLHAVGDIYAQNGWVRTSGQKGLYSQSYNIRLRPLNGNYWQLWSNRGMEIRNKAGTRKGVLYHNNENGFGLLDGDGNWGLRLERDNYTAFLINNSEKMRIKSNGHVGINTANPLGELHIKTSEEKSADLILTGKSRGDQWNTSLLRFNATNHTGIWDIVHRGGKDVDNHKDLMMWYKDGGAWGNIMTYKTNGKVGVGVTTPTAKLDVAGDLRVRNIPVGGTHMVTVDGNGNFRKQPIPTGGTGTPDNLGNHCATQDLDMKSFDIKNAKDVYANSSVQVGMIPGGPTVTTTGTDILASAGLEISAIADITLLPGNPAGGSSLYLDPNKSDKVGIGTWAPDPATYLTVDGKTKIKNDLYVDTKIGVNTMTPTQALDVNGTIRARIDVKVDRDLLANQDVFANRNIIAGEDALVNRDVIVGQDVRVVRDLYTGNKLGIKVPAPTHELDVDGHVRVRNLPPSYNLSIVTADMDGVLHISDFTPEELFEPSLPADPDNMGNHCATQDLDMKGFKILNIEKVGIKTPVPTHELDVNGQARVRNLPIDDFLPIITVDSSGVLHQSEFSPVELLGQQALIDEQADQIKNLQQEVTELKELVNTFIKQQNPNINHQNIQLDENGAYLEQNQPNPFNNNTLIKYNVPTDATDAVINVFDINGQLIHSEVITNTVKGEIQLKVGTIAAGTYSYSLVVNGKVVDTKRMVIVK